MHELARQLKGFQRSSLCETQYSLHVFAPNDARVAGYDAKGLQQHAPAFAKVTGTPCAVAAASGGVVGAGVPD